MQKLVISDWKDVDGFIEELQSALQEMGVHMYPDPRSVGNDDIAYIVSDTELSPEEVDEVSKVWWGDIYDDEDDDEDEEEGEEESEEEDDFFNIKESLDGGPLRESLEDIWEDIPEGQGIGWFVKKAREYFDVSDEILIDFFHQHEPYASDKNIKYWLSDDDEFFDLNEGPLDPGESDFEKAEKINNVTDDACPTCGTPYEEWELIDGLWTCPTCGYSVGQDEF